MSVNTINNPNSYVGNLNNLTTENKSNIVGAINELNSRIGQIVAPNAGSHNSIYRGAYIGSSVTTAQWAAIKAGTFDNLFIGDYWTINGVNWRIAMFDYWIRGNDTPEHHVIIVPDSCLTSCKINNAISTAGGYAGSDFFTGNNSNTGRATARNVISGAFGASHILTRWTLLSSEVTNGCVTSVAWKQTDIDPMSEQMLYGCRLFGNELNKDVQKMNATLNMVQLRLFAYRPDMINISETYWLMDITSNTNYSSMYNNGRPGEDPPNQIYGIRPAFGIYQA